MVDNVIIIVLTVSATTPSTSRSVSLLILTLTPHLQNIPLKMDVDIELSARLSTAASIS